MKVSTPASQLGNSPTSTQLFVLMALEKILQSKEVKKYPKLKESATQSLGTCASAVFYCGDIEHADIASLTELLKKLFELNDTRRVTMAIPSEHMRPIFASLQMACQTRSTLLMAVALDCLGKLISYNILEGSSANSNNKQRAVVAMDDPEKDELSKPSSGPLQPADVQDENNSLIDLTVETICECFVGENTDETVQLQVIKALLAAVSSTVVPIHGSLLLKSIRTTYNIFLLSRTQSIQTVAQGTLTQMMQIVFGRVKHISASPSRASTRNGMTRPSGLENVSDMTSSRTAELALTTFIPNMTDTIVILPVSEGSTSLPSSEQYSANGSTTSETNTSPLASTLISSNPTETKSDTVEASELGTDGIDSERADTPTDQRDLVDGTLRPLSGATDRDSFVTQPATENELFLRDAFLVFRALCKLSTKSLSSESMIDLKTPALRSRILALHLILSIMTTHPHIMLCSIASPYAVNPSVQILFAEAVKSYLILAVSRSAVSSLPPIFEVALEIFAKIVAGLRHLFKQEIEIFLSEILLPLLEMRNATFQQKYGFLGCCSKIFSIPQALVEVYLNYDCEKEALDNIFERLVNAVSRITATPVSSMGEISSPMTISNASSSSFSDSTITLPPTLATMNAPSPMPGSPHGTPDVALKRRSLDALVVIIRSMAQWCKQPIRATTPELPSVASDTNNHEDDPAADNEVDNLTQIDSSDRPEHFESMKHRKTLLSDGIKKFNAKPKKGIAFLVENNFIPNHTPVSIAHFLATCEGLNKVAIGEYLGEGDAENIVIMHALVDQMDFTGMQFVDALRMMLQSFRLPGEAQKIDRFMLKFAERFTTNNPSVFANADTGYVLSYSVILLNTDQHNPQVKNRMTKQEFIRNNRGINDNADVPEEILTGIYNEIVANEIKLKDDPLADASKMQGAAAINAGGAAVAERRTRKQKREAYALALEEIATKVESLFKSAPKKGKSSPYHFATHYEHVRPMFELVWMGVLAGISAPLQESEDPEIISICLEGFKHAVHIICVFDMELERNAFITTISKFTFLNNLGEMRQKNMETIKTLLEIALTEGNCLKGSWLEVLTCVSQLERFQLISGGITSDSVPDISLAKRINLAAVNNTSKKSGVGQRVSPRPQPISSIVTDAAAMDSLSQSVVVAVDRIFATTVKLSGPAIVDFVKWLCHVSWEEIQSSAHVERPRMFSLQKLVEISYYNMNRIRMEWSNLWAILGDHFNKVGCHTNTNVAFFALDSLRQLSMKFLEKDELSNFKFQREFLKPFEHVISNNSTLSIKDMVLRCLQQMVQARAALIKSGWKTLLGVFAIAAKDENEQIVTFAFDVAKAIFKNSFGSVVQNNTYTDFITCTVAFAKNRSYLKISLQSVEMIHQAVPLVAEVAQKELTNGPKIEENVPAAEDPSLRLWFPTLFGLHEVVMTGDLEVRTRALNYLFETLKHHGRSYTRDFWQVLASGVLFPIFDDLRSGRSDYTKFSNREDMSVWLSTTLIQALRQFVDLFTFYFDTLQFLMAGLLDLLKVCIVQENETLARLGTSCLQQLIENNADKLNEQNWLSLCDAFRELFDATTAYALFEGTGDREILMKMHDQNQHQLALLTVSEPSSPPNVLTASNSEGSLANQPTQALVGTAASDENQPLTLSMVTIQHKERSFQQIIVKCVLQLLLIQTLNEMLVLNDTVYRHLASRHLLTFLDCLEKSYTFAKRFNVNLELRTSLWKAGFTKQLPNLLKQETTSVSSFVSVLIKMYTDKGLDRLHVHEGVEKRLVPLCLEILQAYNTMDSEIKRRNIGAWRPVIVTVLYGLSSFNDDSFRRHIPRFYHSIVDLLLVDFSEDLRAVLHSTLKRTGEVYMISESSKVNA